MITRAASSGSTMEVMDTSPGLPQPEQTLSTTHETSRKRSLNDVDDSMDVDSDAGEKENQENTASDQKSSAETDSAENPAQQAEGERTSKPQPEVIKDNVRVEIPLNVIPPPNTTTEHSEQSTTPAAKRRKVSPASKEAKQQEKEAKEKARKDEEKAKKDEEKAKKEEEKAKKEEEKAKKEEEKVKKEEEKRAKDEEKRKREAEREEEKKKKEAEREEEKKRREEKKKAKEEEKAQKEEEKRKKEEEKSKKARAQTRLNSFFAKPKTSTESSNPSSGAAPKESSNGAADEGTAKTASDYYRIFPEFFLQSHTVVAPPHRFQRDSEALDSMRQKVDESLHNDDDSQDPPVFRPSEVFRMIPYKRRRGRQATTVKDILLQLQHMGSSGDGATTVEPPPGQRPQDLLNKVRMKSLRFGEDVRPPYQGTFTRNVPEPSAKKLSRNPFSRNLPATNYDYESEAEWEEPEEGEDLDSEEEEEMSDDGEDDMDGFLDDDDDQPVDGKRRLIVGDLEPQSSGLRWQENDIDPVLHMYKIEPISDSVSFPIDPFSTAYWQKPSKSNGTAPAIPPSNPNGTGAEGSNKTSNNNGLAILGSGPGKAKRSFPPEQLGEFKSAVNGSDLSKLGLVEILKKKFPKVSKEVLKDTLTSTATRVGSKESEKKWVCK